MKKGIITVVLGLSLLGAGLSSVADGVAQVSSSSVNSLLLGQICIITGPFRRHCHKGS